ncbi:hypothetical protein [Ulvibacter antarcticus]|uniref:DUF4384 domain-containing protein n=1 Tax=Ulvibacter antarcticus TaxID=442714 RepID=A0A3L9YX01_9FLAO|nr:hypothetical protein [Ulvibacter antarcticus]RMA64330.1 hypothetical protein BXY75_1203 [Ulvibacter antarcticus]
MKKTVLLLLVCTIYSVSAKNPKTSVVVDTTEVFNESLTYKVVQDNEYLQLSISTKDNDIIMSMLSLGVTVFFDVKGKEKENVYIKYPLEPVKTNFNKGQVPLDGFQTSEEETKRRQQIAKLIENDLPQEAAYNYFDSQEQFHILLNSLDTSLSYIYDPQKGLLEYRLKIPKRRISANSKEDFSKLAIGVKTGKLPDHKPKEDDSSRRPESKKRGGGRPSGGRGGGRPNNSERPESQNRQSSMATIDFWFMASE